MLTLRPGLVDFLPQIRKLKNNRVQSIPDWITEPLRDYFVDDATSNWEQAQNKMVRVQLPMSLEWLERQAANESVAVTHPLADPQLVDFLAALPAHLRFMKGWPKAIPRFAYQDLLPQQVSWRLSKTLFDETLDQALSPQNLIRQLGASPQRVPGVDWAMLQTAITDGMPLSRRLLAARLLVADAFLEKM
jgi:hypothetical protein